MMHPTSSKTTSPPARAGIGRRLVAGLLLVPAACGVHAQDRPGADAAALAQAKALLEDAIRSEHGEGRERDFARAERLYCDAARAGLGDAVVRLGWMYANGRGVARDDALANGLFVQAAGWGHEMGARLAGVVRSDTPALPACLTRERTASREPVARTEAPAATTAGSLLPTPRVDTPAVFRKPPETPERRRIIAAVLRMAPQFRLDPRLVLAVMHTESNFNPLAQSPKNASGLMQLIPETAERFNVRDVFDPVENLRGGMAYLRWLLAYFRGDVTLALAAYNAGERTVDRYRGVPPFAETMAYVQRIRAQYPFDRHPYDARATQPSVVSFDGGSTEVRRASDTARLPRGGG